MFTIDLDSTKASGSMMQLINGSHWKQKHFGSTSFNHCVKRAIDHIKRKGRTPKIQAGSCAWIAEFEVLFLKCTHMFI